MKAVVRNNMWGKHEEVFETIKQTKKLVCPYAHTHDIFLECDDGIYSYDGMNKYANQFLNKIDENDIVLLYDRQSDNALVLKIISIPIQDKINDVIILRNKQCIHTPIQHGCDRCNSSIVMIFSTTYFEKNCKEFTKYINENYCFENMYGIFRHIEIIGKINPTSECFHIHKCLPSSIRIPKNELLLPIHDIIPI
jgi:hypothetical protein